MTGPLCFERNCGLSLQPDNPLLVLSNNIQRVAYFVQNAVNFVQYLISMCFISTVMILSFRTDRPGQIVQTQIRLLLEEQSDQGLYCLQFPLHHLNALL